jgi:hypothetical protein
MLATDTIWTRRSDDPAVVAVARLGMSGDASDGLVRPEGTRVVSGREVAHHGQHAAMVVGAVVESEQLVDA